MSRRAISLISIVVAGLVLVFILKRSRRSSPSSPLSDEEPLFIG